MLAREPTMMSPRFLELFLVIERPRVRLDAWINALAELDAPRAPRLVSVAAYYNASADTALLGVLYERCVFTKDARQYVIETAQAARVELVQPDKLTEEERNQFVDERLAGCDAHLEAQPGLLSAAADLMRVVMRRRSPTAPPLPPLTMRSLPPPIPPLVSAKGTRDDLVPVELDDIIDEQTAPHAAPRLDRRATNKLPARTAARGSSPPPRRDEDHVTSRIDLAAFEAMAASKRVPDRIRVLFLRGGRWLAARIGGLSLHGATLLTGAPPRLNDHVDVSFTFGEHRALVRGVVAKLATQPNAAGAAVFTVSFQLDEHSRPALTALLVCARDARVSITPPPSRSARRFPVEWHVTLGTPNGPVKATALDVSAGGMFVQPSVPLLLDTTMNVSLMLDDGYPPITGRAKAVRRIADAEARASGVAAGVGLEILEMSPLHRERWLRFLGRVERRTQKRVLLGAHPARFADLQAGLANLGYAVIGGTDPAMLVHLANNTRPADAVLLDTGWLHDEASASIVEELMAARHVPCLRMQGELAGAREALDKLLEVI